jgi:hypothetical protein
MDLIVNKVNWDDLKNKLKRIYPQLTEADMITSDGNEDIMLRMIEYKLRKTKKEMRKIIVEIGYSPSEIYYT